ncbi:MAG: 2-hydroxyacyl-CoA dehydratase [Lachnospiraceae bacterium]|nr:2-hydroxyacyl-CoA dehydratase [Lachnospiraceae bacterium]
MEINVNEAAAKDLLAYFQNKMDEEARNAHKDGRLVCWSAALAPAEFCEAMDVAMVYPETHSAGCGAKKGNMGLLEAADKKGYNIDICSYARNNIGFMEMLKQEKATGSAPEALTESRAARVPLPDFVFTCNNICNTLLKWYENLARELDIPCIIIDAPYNHTMPVSRHNKEYMVEQFRDVIEKLEKICKKPFDYEKFYQAQVQTQRTVYQWNRVAALASRKPSPLNGFDLFNYMAMAVMCRPKKAGEIVLKKFADELEANAAAGRFAFGAPENEKNRVTWEGIAVWPNLGLTFKTLKGAGNLMTGSAYPGMWDFKYIPGDLTSMAETYTKVYLNCGAPHRYEEFYKVVDNSRSEGIILHTNRSCKIMAFLNQEGAEYINARSGVPFTSFDGDQTDPRVFTPAQFETRIQALTETMENRKK